MDPKGHTEAITEIVQEGLPGVPGKRLQIFFSQKEIIELQYTSSIRLTQSF